MSKEQEPSKARPRASKKAPQPPVITLTPDETPERAFEHIRRDLLDAEYGANPAESTRHLINAIARLTGIVCELAESQSNHQPNRTSDGRSREYVR